MSANTAICWAFRLKGAVERRSAMADQYAVNEAITSAAVQARTRKIGSSFSNFGNEASSVR
jgi:hypothetical protein